MGLLDKTEWQGKWIGAEKDVSSPLLRKAFSLKKEIKGATIHVSGLGYYELYLNGDKVGDHVLDPGTTYYHNDQPFRLDPRVLYVTYDVTKHLRRGPNAVGVMLGHGWYSKEADIPPSPSFRDSYSDRPRLILQLNLEFLDGEKANLVTDGSWKASQGPILYNDFCNGETYDARLEEPDWATPEFDDSHWAGAQTLKAPNGRLTAQMLPPIKVMKTIKPVRLLAPREGVYVYDFGQNFSGWTRLRVSGPKGAKVTLKHGARIYGDQTLDARSNLYNCPTSEEAYLRGTGRRKGWHHCSRQTDTYILKGKGTEVWEPRFTLHGFRYAEVTGFPGTPTLASLEGRFVRSAVRTSGRFTSSNPLINRIHDMVCWTFMGSFQSMPQDAADRAERVAWLGDPGFITEDIIYNYDTASFWTKWLNDIKDSQRPDGNIPFVSPIHWRQAVPSLGELQQSTFNVYEPWPCWQSTYPLIAWYLYQYYGDERVLNEHYNGLKKLIDFFATKAEGQLLPFGLGDHMEPQPESRTSRDSPKHTPASLASTAYYYYDTWILSQVAEILGKTNDAQHYSSLAEQIKKAFNQKFFHPATKQYATGSQTSNALPLYLGLVPKENREAVVRNLVNDILVTHQGHLSTGIVGLNALEQALPEYGRADVMYTIATQTSWPSWGYLLQQGATTLWETWEGDGEREYSLNMKMFGNTEKFFYKDLAGISPASPGYQQISVKPRLVGDLRYARAAVKTIRGLASVDWRKSRTSFTMRLIIPVNSTARIHIPKMGLKEVSVPGPGDGAVFHLTAGEVAEDGKWVVIHRAGQFVKKVAGITASAETSEYITFAAGSGSYAFELSGRD